MNRQFRERVLDRLSKLLELSNSPNSHEAATASRLADALMRKHGLTKEDVRNYTCESRSGVFELPLGAKGFETAWKWALVTATARSCGCEAVALLVAERRKIRLVGDRADVERAARLFKSILAMFADLEQDDTADLFMSAQRHRFWDTTPADYADSFRRGMTVAVIELLARGSSTQGSSTQGSSTQGSSTQGSSTQGSSTQGSATQGPATQGPATQGSTTQGSTTQGSTTQGSATPSVRNASPEAGSIARPAQRQRFGTQERVNERYAPRRAFLNLADAADDEAFARGYERASTVIALFPEHAVKKRG